MTILILGLGREVLGALFLPANTRLADLEAMRQFGAHHVEVINEKSKARR